MDFPLFPPKFIEISTKILKKINAQEYWNTRKGTEADSFSFFITETLCYE